jgi:hypothetical protein
MSWPDAYVARFILNKSVNVKQGMDIVSRPKLTIFKTKHLYTSILRPSVFMAICGHAWDPTFTAPATPVVSLESIASQSIGRPSPALRRRRVCKPCAADDVQREHGEDLHDDGGASHGGQAAADMPTPRPRQVIKS